MKNTQPPITLDETIYLRKKLEDIYFPNDDKKVVYDSKEVKQFLDIINSERVGIPKGTSPKQIGIKLEEWFEILKQGNTTTTELPQYEAQNSTTGFDLETKVEKLEEREAAIKQTREKAVSDVASTQARLKEIYDQQRIIQEQIKKVEKLQPEYDGKKAYATVTQTVAQIKPDTKQSIETLVGYATYTETRTPLINQVTEAIQTKITPDELVARTLAVQLVSDLTHKEEIQQTIRETAIEEALANDPILEKVLQKEKTLIEVAKKGAILEVERLKDSVYLSRGVAENIFGKEIAEEIYGSKQTRVILSSEKSEQSTDEIDLGSLNKVYGENLKERNKFLENVREEGVDGAKSIFRNQLYSNVNTYLAKAPKESALGKVYSSDAVKAILTKGSPNAIELKYFGKNPLLQTYFKYSPESMPYFKLFTEVTSVSVGVGTATKIIPLTYGGGAIPLAKIAFIQPVKSLGVPYTLGIKTGAKFAVGTAAKTAVTTTLSTTLATITAAIPVPVLNVILAAVVWVGAELISKAKELWTKHKDKIGPGLAIGAGVGGLMIFGPVGMLVGGGLGLAVTGSLATFATGAVGVLGFIGRSIGIAIATPVIVTLLVLPPLVALIMLVINNSAYVVPPSPPLSSLLGADNPYMLVTKTANPSKLENSNSRQTVIYVVAIKALKTTLTNIKVIGTDCKVIKTDGTKIECPPEILPDDNENTSISPSQDKAFSFTSSYDSRYNDSLIIDSVTISAEAEGETVTTSGSASVCIGECPKNCAQVSNNGDTWPPKLAEKVNIAIGNLSQYQGFTAKLCPSNEPINLCYKPSEIDPDYYAWHVSNYYGDNCDIYFNSKGISSDSDALFMITHELTHHIQAISSEHEISYSVSGGWIPEIFQIFGRGEGLCTYSATVPAEPEKILEAMREGMAEAAALYTNSSPSWDSCAANYSSKYPRNYVWAKKFMEE